MLSTFISILKDNWEWRRQIGSLALFDLKKKSRGASLGWAWFFVKPILYIFCFWFALEVGLRSGSTSTGAPPYILWLTAGIIPWFFMQEMLNGGSNVLRKYPYLVNKIKFPLSGISSIYACASMIIHALLLIALFAIYLFCGMKLDIYLLQIPLLMILMFIYWDMFSILLSPLSAISKDIANLMKAITTPVFWLSGVIFNVGKINIPIVQAILHYNPVTFFAKAYRMAFYDKEWIWNDVHACIGFLVTFIVTFVLMLIVYKRFNQEVADVF